MAFVLVYSKSTGRKHRVPEHWLGHPVLGANIRKTPLAEKQSRTKTDTPVDGDKE